MGNRYGEIGVDYDVLDAGKRSAIEQAAATSGLIAAHGGRVVEASRGSSAFVFELGGQQLAFVVEGLGTKSLLAREWEERTGADRFADIAVDAVAAIVNDVLSVGALPVVVNAYFATGRSDWRAHGSRGASLLHGWRHACELAGAVWGGGESPALPELVAPTDVELAGACVGAVPPEWGPLLGEQLRGGEAIVLVQSSGLHANGASLARAAAAKLPDGLATAMPSGIAFGDALLTPSLIYASLLAELRKRRLTPSYFAHVTGHGLRKLMRPPHDIVHVVDALPPVPEVLAFLAEQSEMDEREAYGTFNMGAGFAVYATPEEADDVVAAATAVGLTATVAGHTEAGERSVELPELDVTYAGDELELA